MKEFLVQIFLDDRLHECFYVCSPSYVQAIKDISSNYKKGVKRVMVDTVRDCGNNELDQFTFLKLSMCELLPTLRKQRILYFSDVSVPREEFITINPFPQT